MRTGHECEINQSGVDEELLNKSFEGVRDQVSLQQIKKSVREVGLIGTFYIEANSQTFCCIYSYKIYIQSDYKGLYMKLTLEVDEIRLPSRSKEYNFLSFVAFNSVSFCLTKKRYEKCLKTKKEESEICNKMEYIFKLLYKKIPRYKETKY